FIFSTLEIWLRLLPIPLNSFAICVRVSLSNFGLTSLLPCALLFTNCGTLIFKVSADCFNFEYSFSLTLKEICFGSLRTGLRNFPLATDYFVRSLKPTLSNHTNKFIIIYLYIHINKLTDFKGFGK